MDSNAYAVIMAGGRGERFWPQSRQSHPKQLLRLLGNLTLIEQTVNRLTPLFPPERIVIITNQDYAAPMRSLLGAVPAENIIGEPVGRDTAPCVAMAAAFVRSIAKEPDPVIALFSADHVINDAVHFRATIADCAVCARREKGIVTIGIPPSFPSTGYGYIEVGDEVNAGTATRFRTGLGFKEKPCLETAKEYLASGRFRWNSGMFVMTHETIYRAFCEHAPFLRDFHDALLARFQRGDRTPPADLYESVRKISIDYAIMEKADCIRVAAADFDWDDVGTWTSMRNQIRPEAHNNVVRGLYAGVDTSDCIIVGSAKHLIATVGVKDLVIVNTEDATLVCDAKSAQRVNEIVRLISSIPELKSFL